ncbi:CHAT domain-containing protein [Nocardia sp. NPDC059240]|uniref:CHAT domain-containing protein n=1 Tax=Nocardia sp. NPDC059240 TaxID=3346786 RepID=UPI00368B66C0
MTGDDTIPDDEPADLSALRALIAELRAMLAQLPHHHPQRAAYLHDLSLALHAEARHTGDIEKLREAVHKADEGVAATADAPNDDPVRVLSRINHRNILAAWFEYSDDVEDLRALVDADERVIAVAATDHPDRVAMLYLRWADLAELGQRVPTPALLDKIADAARTAVAAVPVDDPDWAAAQKDLIGALLGLYERSSKIALLEEGARIGRATVVRVAADSPDRPGLLSVLWQAISMADPRSSESAAVFDLVDDIELLREIADSARSDWANTPPEHPQWAGAAHTLCHALRVLAERVDDERRLLTELLHTARKAAGSPVADDAILRALALDQLFAATTLFDGGHPEVSAADIDQAARATLAVFPGSVPAVPDLLAVSRGLRTVTDCVSDPAALRRAESMARTLLANLPTGDPRGIEQRQILSFLRQFHYEQTHEIRTAQEAVQLAREACTAAADAGKATPELLLTFGWALEQLVEATDDQAVLAEAVDVWRDIVSATTDSPEHRDHQATFGGLTRKLLLQQPSAALMRELCATLEALGRVGVDLLSTIAVTAVMSVLDPSTDIDVVQQQIQWARQALDSDEPSRSDRASALTTLAISLTALAHRTADRRTLSEALDLARQAVAVCPLDDPDRPATEFNLAFVLVSWYDEAGAPAALQEAEQICRQALRTLPEHDLGHSIYVSIAADVLKRLAERTGDQGLLWEAGRIARAAAESTPVDDIARPSVVANLGRILGDSYQATGDRSAGREAVRLARQAVETTPADAVGYYALLDALGHSLLLHQRSNDPRNLTEAIDARRAALDACPPENADITRLQVNLSLCLARSFDLTGDKRDIDEAIELCRQAITARGDENPLRRASDISILADHLHHLSAATFDLATHNDCLRLRREAVALTPSDHVYWAQRHTSLGAELAYRLMATQDRRILPETLTVLRCASAATIAPISHRIAAARLLEFAETAAGNAENALAAIELVVELLPNVATRSLQRSDREYTLSRQAGLAASAAGAAVAAKQPARAVELLEHCRGILLGEAMDDRRDFAELAAAAPQLAAELAAVRDRLVMAEDAVRVDGRQVLDDADAAEVDKIDDQRRELGARWTALLDEARRMPGFERLLRPPDIEALRRQAAVDGPIVILFVHLPPVGGHALVIPADPEDPVRAVPLPQLTPLARIQKLKSLDDIVSGQHSSLAARTRAENQLHELLEWLWDAIADPVLTELRIAEPTGKLPRVWWCPVGDLAFLPIQAAGYHRQQAGRTVLDRTISSFVTTLRALGHNTEHTAAAGNSAVLIAMPETDGAPTLRGADRELADIAALLPDTQILRSSAATGRSVADALTRHPIAHIACHAVDDPDEPGNSRLLLHDHHTDPFTVRRLLRLHLNHAELAYLSACSTTRTGPQHADEAIHLTATIHLAGYRHVIGTLWPVNDTAAADIAANFYRRLTDNGKHPAKTELSAHALNEAIRRHRDRYRSAPTRWAAHLHHGL